jgi:hypothetical protein
MAMITAAQLKAIVDPVPIIRETVRLRKFGRRYSGLCPFHSEKNPSFSYWESSQQWKCFGCGKSGDIYDFIELRDGVDFRGALRQVAAIAGIPIDLRDTYEEPSLALKLSGPEVRAFDNFLSSEMHRLAARLRFLDQQEAACMAYLEGCWSATDESLDRKAIEDVHRTLNLIHETKYLIEERMLALDTDPTSEIEPFLRRLYGNEDFRLAVTA